MNKKVKKLSAASLLVGSLLSAATLRGTPTDASFSFLICEEIGTEDFDKNGYVLSGVPTLEKWNGCLTYFFINGQNNVTDVSTIQGLLNKGDTAFVDNAICSATVSSIYPGTGSEYATANGSNPSKLDLGNYTAFAVLFDAKSSTEITKESTKYLVLNDLQQQKFTHYDDPETKKVITGYSYQFYHGSAATLASNEGNWGDVWRHPGADERCYDPPRRRRARVEEETRVGVGHESSRIDTNFFLTGLTRLTRFLTTDCRDLHG